MWPMEASRALIYMCLVSCVIFLYVLPYHAIIIQWVQKKLQNHIPIEFSAGVAC